MSGRGGCLPGSLRGCTRFELGAYMPSCHQGHVTSNMIVTRSPAVCTPMTSCYACTPLCRQFSWCQLPCRQTQQLLEQLLMLLQRTMQQQLVSQMVTSRLCSSHLGWEPLWHLQLLLQPSRYAAKVLRLGPACQLASAVIHSFQWEGCTTRSWQIASSSCACSCCLGHPSMWPRCWGMGLPFSLHVQPDAPYIKTWPTGG